MSETYLQNYPVRQQIEQQIKSKDIAFLKMNGLGNDFVIINRNDIEHISDLTRLIAYTSDRRVGIGYDQLIIYKLQNGRVFIDIYNPNGSKAKNCGNASRCLSRLMFDKYQLKEIVIELEDRTMFCRYISPQEIEVNMGTASFNSVWMPKAEDLGSLAERYRIEAKEMICVDMGNPHLVIFSKLTEQDQEIIGTDFQKTELFKDGININFATINDDVISLKVFERGTNFTLACGSGACSTFAAANKLGFVGDKATVLFTLGALKLSKSGDIITMSGPASYSFSGILYVNEI